MDTPFSRFWFSAGLRGPVPEATAFGDSSKQQDELCKLVLLGVKRGTASLSSWYDPPTTPFPKPGDRKIVVDGSGVPCGIIETVAVGERPFNTVTEAFACLEGEGDKTLGYWQAEHRRYFAAQQEADGLTFSDDALVICESFRLIYSQVFCASAEDN